MIVPMRPFFLAGRIASAVSGAPIVHSEPDTGQVRRGAELAAQAAVDQAPDPNPNVKDK
jgi:hypothetical protein